jgi:type IV pilus assembly protein PilV
MNLRPIPTRRQRGIALLEAMIAIVILGIGLIGTVGLQARAYSALSDAGMRTEATMAAEKLLGTMSADLANITSYSLAANDTPNQFVGAWVRETQRFIPGAVTSVTVTPLVGRVKVDITITWRRKAKDDESSHVVTAYIAT